MDAKIHKFLIVRKFRNEIFVQLKISPNIPLSPLPVSSPTPRVADGDGTAGGEKGEERGLIFDYAPSACRDANTRRDAKFCVSTITTIIIVRR